MGMSTKYKVNQIVQISTTNPNNTRKASVVVAGNSGADGSQNVYLIQTDEAQYLVMEPQVRSQV